MGQLNYQGGRGFEQDRNKAFEYFSRAAESGNGNAQGYLGKIYAEGSGRVKQNNETAIKYFKLAADQVRCAGGQCKCGGSFWWNLFLCIYLHVQCVPVKGICLKCECSRDLYRCIRC